MKCPSCGKDNPAGEQYCLDCGSDLSAAAPAGAATSATATPTAAAPAAAGGSAATPAGGAAAAAGSAAMSDEEFQRLLNTPPAARTCPHCGAPAPAAGTFCDSCGQPLSADAAPAAGTPTDPGAAATAAAVQPDAAASLLPTAPIGPPPTVPIGPPPSAPVSPPAATGTVTFDLSGPTSSSSYTMSGAEAKIGRRDAEAGIYPEIDFDGNDIVVDAGERVHAVSRRHGRIFEDGGELKFEDTGSTNGSTLNAAAVLPHDPQPLHDGDRIVLGRTCRITVHIA